MSAGEGTTLDPVRTCLGCRQRAGKTALVRVVVRNGEVVVDEFATLPGRGAWLHPAAGCVENAIKRKAFGRAFRLTAAPDVRGLRQAFTEYQAVPDGTSSEVL